MGYILRIMKRTRVTTLAILILAALAHRAAWGDELVSSTIGIDVAAGLQPEAAPATKVPPSADAPLDESKTSVAPRPAYGSAKSQAWTVGGLYAYDFKGENDLNLHVDYSIFLADNLEFAVEVAGWYFDQKNQKTGGISGSMIFRWHFLHADDYKWSIFGDAGIGILGAFDDVPNGGTGFDFLPRLGGGFTHRLGDEPNSPRLMVGLRWHHISNARIQGDSRNPSRDSLAFYAAIVFPF